jgi:NAD(P)-dependent dehydrogenase (short-subunit alcohol dehydrogenase family)
VIGSFDAPGYRRHARRFDPRDLDVDLSGRRCLVTGSGGGLGRAAALGLARLGATVHLLVRDRGRGERARDELRAESGSSRIEVEVADVSDLGALARWARGFAADAIDVLVHNAGVLPAARALTADGLELTFATHVAGPHLLTRLLAPRLRAAGDARVVWVSSGGMYTQRLSLADLGWERRPYDGVRAYAQTKRMQVELAARWARELGPAVHVSAMHPGWADTPGVETSLPRFHARLRARLRTPAEGADTIVWLAARRPAPSPSGAFWFDRRARWTHYLPWTRTGAATRAALWALAERVTDPFAS